MSEAQKLYWDSSCFICFLNKNEADRRVICEDILTHARNRSVEIWTSTWSIIEVVRPKRHGSAPLPRWAAKAIEAVKKEFPNAPGELETLWKRYQSNDPSTKLTPEQIEKIQGMFEWDFVKVKTLIRVEDPQQISEQNSLFVRTGIGPTPADFDDKKSKTETSK